MHALSTTERKDLARLEGTLEAGLKTFFDVGHALAEIRERRLYRATHKTFEDYCREKWGFSRQRGQQLIAAAEVTTIVDVRNEAQARVLAGATPSAMRETVARAGEDTTARELEDLLKQVQKEEEEALASGKQERPSPRPRDRRPGRDRVNQIESLAKRLRGLHAGLVDVADQADAALDGYLQVVRSSSED
jgi:hypothetical protein